MGRSVRLERPHLHLTESLAAELRLTGERLLGHQRVRPDRSRVNLVVDQVRELEHIDRAHGDVALERMTGSPVAEPDLAYRRQAGGPNQGVGGRADFRRSRGPAQEWS